MDSHLSHTVPECAWRSRFYETEHDFQQMQALLMEARARTNDWRYGHVGDLAFGFWMVACHLNPHEHIRLWHDSGGRLVAFAMLGEDPFFDCQVLPEYAWSGIETEALAWADTLVAALRTRDASRWSGHLRSGARQDDAHRIAFLEQHGFQRGAYAEVNMLRRLDESIAEAALPAGCQVRAVAEAGEVADRAAVQREVWQPWTVGNVSNDDYARLMQLPGYHRDLDIVAVTEDGVIAAYVNGWIDPVNRIGDFGPVGTRPAYRRQGLARAALLEGLRCMQARGMNRVCVSTGVANTPARQLYESVGFRVVNTYHEYVKTE